MAAPEPSFKAAMTSPKESFDNSQITAHLISPRLLEFGSPSRCGGSGLYPVNYTSRSEYDVARFFSARDILDLINQLHKSAKIALDEATGIQGNEQVNRIKAKCSKVCGLANRLIDLYVATIKAKVARILRKLGLGLDKGQELLYHHLSVLQGLVDQAFASFNAVQYADAARIRQAKLHAGIRRESSAVNLTWRSPTERKPPFRPGSHGSAPQPPQHLDVKDLLLEARKKFMIMAEELVDLKEKLIVLDRARIQAAIMAAEAEGEVPDPLPSLKAASSSLTYGFNTRFLSESGCITLSHRDAAQLPSPRDIRSLRTLAPTQSPRTSRLIRSSLEAPSSAAGMALPPLLASAAAQAGPASHRSSSPAFRGISEPGGTADEEAHDTWVGSPSSADGTARSRMVISDGGGSGRERRASGSSLGGSGLHPPSWRALGPIVHTEVEEPAAGASRLLQAAFLREADDGPLASLVSVGAAGPEGESRSYVPVSVEHDAGLIVARARASNPGSGFLWTLSNRTSAAGGDAVPSDAAFNTYNSHLQARDVTTGALVRQAANMAGQVISLEQEKEENREALRDVVAEALRLVERDPTNLDAALRVQQIPRETFDGQVARCKAPDAELKDLQSMLRTCIALLGDQLREFALGAASPGATPSTNANAVIGAIPPSRHPVCARCGELAAFLDELLPMINHATVPRDRTATADLGAVPSTHIVFDLAPDGSQDEVVLLPMAGELEDGANETDDVLVVVLQRLTTVLERLHRLEDNSQELEERLERERRERTEAQAQAARLKEDRDDTGASLAATRERLLASERQIEQLRAQLMDAASELQAKAAEVSALQEQLLEDGSKRTALSPTGGLTLLGVATEMELEGLRVEHENLRAKTEIQSTEIRQLQSEVSGLRAARDKLLEELQEMQVLLQLSKASGAEDPNPSPTKAHAITSIAAAATAEESKAAARALAAARGAPASARGSPRPGKIRASILSVSMDASPLRSAAAHAAKSRQGRDSDFCNAISSLAAVLSPSGPAKKPVRRGIPMPPGMPMPSGIPLLSAGLAGRSASSSTCSTPREPRGNFGAIARLEEIQVQLAQAEKERQSLECQLQAAQSVIASKDSELTTANLMLQEYERMSCAAHPRAARKRLAYNSPPRSLDLAPTNYDGAGSPNPSPPRAMNKGDAVVVIAVSQRQEEPADSAAVCHAAGFAAESSPAQGALPAAVIMDGDMDPVSRVEELQAECEELTRMAAALDEERARAEVSAEERAAELQATKEYIQELEEEAELLREMADKTSMQMAEKEEELFAHVDALNEAREALCRAQNECALQAQCVEEHAAQLREAQAQLVAARARLAELEQRDDEHSRADADALLLLREEIVLLQSRLAASQAALDVMNAELTAARGAVVAADEALAEQRRTTQELSQQLAVMEATRKELVAQVAAAEAAHTDLARQLRNSLASRQELEERLEAAAAAQLEAAAKLSVLEVKYAEAQGRVEAAQANQADLNRTVEAPSSDSLASLREQVALLRSQMAASQAALDLANMELAAARGAVATADEALAEQCRTSEDLRQRLAVMEAIGPKVFEQVAAIEAAYAGLTSELRDSLTSRQELEERLEAAALAQVEMAGKHSALEVAYTEVLGQLKAAQAAKDVAQKVEAALTEELAEAEAERHSALAQLESSRAALQAQAEELNAVEAKRLNLAGELQDTQAAIKGLEAELQTAHASRAQLQDQLANAEGAATKLQDQLADAEAAMQRLSEELCRSTEASSVMAAQLATMRAARDTVYGRSVSMEAALLRLQSQLEHAKAEALVRAECVHAVEQELQRAKERERRLQDQAALDAEVREAEAADLVVMHQQALSAVQERFAAIHAEAEARASRVEALEKSLSDAAEEREQLLLQAATAAAHSEMLEAELLHVRAENATLEVQLSLARAEQAAQADLASRQAAELLQQQEAATAAGIDQAKCFHKEMAFVKAQLEAAIGASAEQASRAAAQVSELGARLVSAQEETSKQAEGHAAKTAELEALLMAAQAAIQDQAERSGGSVAALEQQLAEARAEALKLAEAYRAQVRELEARLAEAKVAAKVEEEKAAARVAELEAELQTARITMIHKVDVSTARAVELSEQLATARGEMAEQAQRSAIQAAELEAELSAAHACMASHVERSNEKVRSLVADLETLRRDASDKADRDAKHAAQLETQLVAARSEQAEQIQRSAAEIARLEACLAIATAKSDEQAKRAAARAGVLELQLAVAAVRDAEQAELTFVQTFELTAQLAAARAELVQQAKRSAQEASELVKQVETARADVVAQSMRFATQAAALGAQVDAARADCALRAKRSAEAVADLEAQLAAAQAEIAEQMKCSAMHVASLEEQLVEAHTTFIAKAAQSAEEAAELELHLAATRHDVASQIQRFATQASTLERDLTAARALNAEQAQQSQMRASELERLLAAVRTQKDEEVKRYAAQAAALSEQLSAARDESSRAAECSAASVFELQLQLTTARKDNVDQVERVRVLESELRNVLTLLSVAKTIQDQQHDDMLQLQAQSANLRVKLDSRDTEIQQLKASLLALQATLQEREEALADREREMKKVQAKLASAIAVMEQSESTVERLQADVAAATLAAEAAAAQQQSNLARAVHEQARFRDLVADLTSVSSNQSRLVAGLRLEVAELRLAGTAPSAPGHRDCRDVSTQLTSAAVATAEAAAQSSRPASPLIAKVDAAAQASQPALAFVASAGISTWVCQQAPTSASVTAEPSLALQGTQRDGYRSIVQSQLYAGPQVFTLDEGQEFEVAEKASSEEASELAGIQRMLVAQQDAAAGLLQSLKTRLAAADADLCQAKARVMELQSQLADAEARMQAAELAATSADAERRRVEAQLANALEDSSEGRALVQQLTRDLARCREEVELVRASLLVKQVLLDQQELLDHPANSKGTDRQADAAAIPEHSPRAPLPAGLQAGGHAQAPTGIDVAEEKGEDEELAEEFLEGVLWGINLGALPGRRMSGPGSVGRRFIPSMNTVARALHSEGGRGAEVVEPRCSFHRTHSSKAESVATGLGALHLNVMELMTRRWQGSSSGATLLEQVPEEAAAGSPEALVTCNWVPDNED